MMVFTLALAFRDVDAQATDGSVGKLAASVWYQSLHFRRVVDGVRLSVWVVAEQEAARFLHANYRLWVGYQVFLDSLLELGIIAISEPCVLDERVKSNGLFHIPNPFSYWLVEVLRLCCSRHHSSL